MIFHYYIYAHKLLRHAANALINLLLLLLLSSGAFLFYCALPHSAVLLLYMFFDVMIMMMLIISRARLKRPTADGRRLFSLSKKNTFIKPIETGWTERNGIHLKQLHSNIVFSVLTVHLLYRARCMRACAFRVLTISGQRTNSNWIFTVSTCCCNINCTEFIDKMRFFITVWPLHASLITHSTNGSMQYMGILSLLYRNLYRLEFFASHWRGLLFAIIILHIFSGEKAMKRSKNALLPLFSIAQFQANRSEEAHFSSSRLSWALRKYHLHFWLRL